MTERLEKRGDFHEVVGDDLFKQFKGWVLISKGNLLSRYGFEKELSDIHLRAFVEWLLSTEAGSTALRRINDCPRQLFLPFGDTDRPWRVVSEESTSSE